MAAMKFPQSRAVVNVWMGCGLVLVLAGVSAGSSAFAGRGAAVALPVCLSRVAITKVQVGRVDPNGDMMLPGGQVVRLESLLWPRKDHGVPDWLLSRTAALLHDLTRGKLNVHLSNPKFDRYGRLRAQVTSSDGKWLQREILVRGLARVSVSPDRRECASPLYAAEDGARRSRRGTLDDIRLPRSQAGIVTPPRPRLVSDRGRTRAEREGHQWTGLPEFWL